MVRFYHEPLAREFGQPLPTFTNPNKVYPTLPYLTLIVSLFFILMPASAVNSRSFASDKALSMKRFPPCGSRFSIMPCTFREERLSPWKVLKSKARSASEPYVIMPTWLFLGPMLKNTTRALAKSSTCNDRKQNN